MSVGIRFFGIGASILLSVILVVYPWSPMVFAARADSHAGGAGGVPAGSGRFHQIIVNGREVPGEYVDSAFKFRRAAIEVFHGPSPESKLEELAAEVEEKEVVKELFIQDAERRTIDVSEEEFRTHLAGEAGRYGGKDKLESFLKRAGLEWNAYENLQRRNFRIGRYFQKAIRAEITVSDQEVKERYEAQRWSYETPETVLFDSLVLASIRSPFTDNEISFLRSIPDKVASRTEYDREVAGLITRFGPKSHVQRNKGLEWDESRGSDLWEYLAQIETQRAGFFENRGRNEYYMYFVIKRTPRDRKVDTEEAMERIRKSIREEKVQAGINARAKDLKNASKIEIR